VAVLVLPRMHGSCIKCTTPKLGFIPVGKLCCRGCLKDSKVHKDSSCSSNSFPQAWAIYAQGLNLLSPSGIWFATNFLMVARVLDVKEALKQKITDVEWDTYVRTLSDTQRKPVWTQAQEVRRLILGDDSEFWQSCTNYCTIMKAAVAALKDFDGKQPCMGNVYIIMRALRHHVVALRNAPFNMLGHLVEPLEVALRNEEAMVASDLHYGGALLNPHLLKDMELRDDQHAMAGLMRVFQRLSDIAEEFGAVKAEFNLYFHTSHHIVESMFGVLWRLRKWLTCGGLQAVVLGSCFLALCRGSLHRWYPRPHVSGIGVATPSCIAKRRIDYFHLVRRTWCMSIPTQESLIKMYRLQMEPQQNGSGKVL
jgi:hypothetical protein